MGDIDQLSRAIGALHTELARLGYTGDFVIELQPCDYDRLRLCAHPSMFIGKASRPGIAINGVEIKRAHPARGRAG